MVKILPSLLLLSVILTAFTSATFSRTGFSLDLIHNLPVNLTRSQLIRKLIQQSQSRISNIKKSILKSQLNTTVIRPPVISQGLLYLVSVTIGTAEGSHSYNLALDTGSSLTWTQCLPCRPCFPQPSPIFDPTLSPSFRYLIHNDPLCVPPYTSQEDGCSYRLFYGDGSEIYGVFSRETFTFQSSIGQPQSFPSLPFGCTTSSYNLIDFDGAAGILGLDASPESFVIQLYDQTGGRFSYCLLPFNVIAPSYLRFGNDITMTGPVQRTPFVIRNGLYDLILYDISIDNQRLDLPQGTFNPRPDGGGGCIIDSGAAITYLIFQAYDAAEDTLVRYFEQFNLEKVNAGEYIMGVELCYKKPIGFNSLPSMTFHFHGADMQIGKEQLFIEIEKNGVTVFCMMIKRDDWMTTIGAYQQYNTRITFDVVNREVLFFPEDCTSNA